MAYRYTADLNTSGTLQTVTPGILVVCCTVRNSTTAIIHVTDNRGQDYTTQPGSSHTFDISPSTQFTYQASAPATGGAQIVYSDAPLADETTSQGQPPGAVTVVGNVSVTGAVGIAGPVTISGTTTVAGSVGISGPVDISGPVTIEGTITNIPQPGSVQTTADQKPVVVHQHIDNAQWDIPLYRSTRRVQLQMQTDKLTRGGVLNVFFFAPALDGTNVPNYLIQNRVYFVESYPGQPEIPYEWDILLPQGATLSVLFAGAIDAAVTY